MEVIKIFIYILALFYIEIILLQIKITDIYFRLARILVYFVLIIIFGCHLSLFILIFINYQDNLLEYGGNVFSVTTATFNDI